MVCGHRCAHRPFWVRRRSRIWDARIIRHTEIARLESEVDKLTRDHQRVKNPAQRNEIYAKLHKAKAQLAKLREA